MGSSQGNPLATTAATGNIAGNHFTAGGGSSTAVPLQTLSLRNLPLYRLTPDTSGTYRTDTIL